VSRLLFIGVGGALGSIARFEVTAFVQSRMGGPYPWGTFVVNVTGCLLMGVAMALLTARQPASEAWRYLVPIGFVGAYTTFSTFEVDLFSANASAAWFVSIAYLAGSVVVGYVALWAGMLLGRSL
jgi:fluoride exporter